MAWTQSQIDALKAAIAVGALTVRHGETMTTYRSLAEMKELLAMMTEEVTPARTRRTVGVFKSGC